MQRVNFLSYVRNLSFYGQRRPWRILNHQFSPTGADAAICSQRAILFCNRTRTTRCQPQEVTISSRIIHDCGVTRSHLPLGATHEIHRLQLIIQKIKL
jgi:hypothetical protein